MTPTIRMAVLGFVAAAISVLVAHQVMVLALYLIGWVPNAPYSFRPNAWGVPVILNSMFWGGLWGVAFAFAAPKIPIPATWLKGIVLGVVGPVVIGNWIVMATIRGQPLFAGFAPQRMLIGVLIGGAFGLGWIYIYQAITRARA